MISLGLLGGCSSVGGEESGAPTDTTPASAEEETEGLSGSFSSLSYNVAGLPQGINPDQFPEQHIPLISPLPLSDHDPLAVEWDWTANQ